MGKTDKIDDAKSVALKFVDVINAGDSEELIRLQTEDFTLIDMAGDVFRGRDGWRARGYFSESKRVPTVTRYYRFLQRRHSGTGIKKNF